jgi:hypothetical protein
MHTPENLTRSSKKPRQVIALGSPPGFREIPCAAGILGMF